MKFDIIDIKFDMKYKWLSFQDIDMQEIVATGQCLIDGVSYNDLVVKIYNCCCVGYKTEVTSNSISKKFTCNQSLNITRIICDEFDNYTTCQYIFSDTKVG